ncbi:SEC-C metal-binding domain-containing protein [Mycobacterium sp.]|uniref:SEC-C metal-binding domain-containing protein n=1 Tax=Mycobacterium sp. TaxID=1785 RepID=UPI003F9DA68A
MSDSSAEPIAAVVRQVLSARGPMTEDDLLDVLNAEGIDLGPDTDAMLAEVLDEDTGPAVPLADGRWAWIPALLDGRIFTHRLSEVEVEHDIIGWGADLAPLAMLTEVDIYQRLVDGSPITDVSPFLDGDVLAARGVPVTAIDSEGALLLPPGHFAALAVVAGDLVGLRVSENGFELATVAETTPCGVGAELAALLQERPDQPEMLDAAVWMVCADDDSVFRSPTAPLGDLLAASGLACEGDWIACDGFDFAAWRVAGRIERIQARYQLDEDEALAVLATVRLYEQTRDLVEAVQAARDSGDEGDLADIVSQSASRSDPTPSDGENEPDPDRTTVRAALEFLADPAVASAALAEASSEDEDSAVALGVFAESAEPLAPRAARPALRWMQGKAYEALGDIEQAEATLHAAESLDPSWPLTLLSLARYASDRGDAERGLALLRRAGAPADHELVQLLERFRPAPRPDLGRNQRCWCGSGRKYKVCHLNREQLPLEERAAWLYQKAGADLLDGPFAPLLVETAQARAQNWDFPDALTVAVQDGLVADAVLFEGGAFADFLDTRGFLLPEDERLLAEQWLLVERSVHEVLDVSRGQGFTLRDVRTGDVHQVRERAASTQVKVGELYCARVVPAGGTMQVFGGMEPVSLGERDDLMALLDDDPGPVELVAALSRRFAPPVLQNTEGEPLMICDARLRVDDPDVLARALDGTYEREHDQPDGTSVWLEHVITHGMERIRAHLELRGDELHVHANSMIRFERVLATVRALDPSVTVLSDTREPAGDLRAVQRLAGRGPAASGQVLDPATDPAIAAALDEMARKHEAAWLDEPIPALAGHTPRECADDPTRRPDLIRLLDSFPQDTSQPGTMSPARLRAALGLD